MKPKSRWVLVAVFGAFLLAIVVSIQQSSNKSREAADKAQRAHVAAAVANHMRRLKWQSDHPKEYAALKSAEREKRAAAAERQRIEIAQASAKRAEDERHAKAAAAAYETEHAHDGCSGAYYYQRVAVEAENNGSHQSAYDNAVAGLARADSCDDTSIPDIKGRLLGTKALSEHHLSSGDSQTDLNQAVTLLAQCQTEPGYYGEHAGASCETAEEVYISYKTQWEMDAQ